MTFVLFVHLSDSGCDEATIPRRADSSPAFFAASSPISSSRSSAVFGLRMYGSTASFAITCNYSWILVSCSFLLQYTPEIWSLGVSRLDGVVES